MKTKFAELRRQMSPAAQARAARLAEKYSSEMALDELRVAREMSQENLAQVLGVKQNAVSKLERRADMYVSSLRNIVRAMGGELEIQAVFPDGVVKIDQFKNLRGGKPSSRSSKNRGARRAGSLGKTPRRHSVGVSAG